MAGAAEQITYVSVDEIAEVAAARQDIREQAWDTIELRRQQLARGESTYVPLPIDALTTAQKVLDAADTYGEDSAEHKELFAGFLLDCSRLVAEWFRKNKPEYFDAVYHAFNAETEEFYSHGLSIRQMTENALTPLSNDPVGEIRRVNERVEDATPHILRKIGGLAMGDVRIRTISECTDKAIADFAYDVANNAPHRGYDGYVPEIQKVMIRDIRLDKVTEGRFEEQVGLPGIYLTHEIFQEALRRRNVASADKDKTDLHGMQLLAHDDLIDFVAHVDAVASEEWCTPIFMGEAVPHNHPKNYDTVRAEAKERQESLKEHSRLVALFVLDLAANNTDPREAPAIVETFVKKLLLNMARHDNVLAGHMFDAKTAQGLRQVAHLESMGREQEAYELYQRVEAAAPGGGYCGAGSCGLEAIRKGSADEKDLKKLGFGDSKDVIKDTERKCRCGAKTVYYDLKQAKKGCTTCGSTARY